MKIEILITEIIGYEETEEINKMKECVKNGVEYKGIKLTKYELLDLGSNRGSPFDGIKFTAIF